MIEIEKRYYIREIVVKVNKREITYDIDYNRATYTYDGINKDHFELTLEKWWQIREKYCKNENTKIHYEEILK